jgi:hypothetical protein
VITAVAPEVLPGERFSAETRGLLAAADALHVHHPGRRVVFAAAVTRWLHGKGFEWNDLDVEFFEALRELDEHAPALEIEATQLSMSVVAAPPHSARSIGRTGAPSRSIDTSNPCGPRCCRRSSATLYGHVLEVGGPQQRSQPARAQRVAAGLAKYLGNRVVETGPRW